MVLVPFLNSNEAHAPSAMQSTAQAPTEIPACDEIEWDSELASLVAASGSAKLRIAAPGQLSPVGAGVGEADGPLVGTAVVGATDGARVCVGVAVGSAVDGTAVVGTALGAGVTGAVVGHAVSLLYSVKNGRSVSRSAVDR